MLFRSPVIMNCLLFVGGGLVNAHMDDSAKHQIVLLKRSHASTLIVIHYHDLSGHSERECVFSLIRTKYWPIKGPTAVHSILNKCMDCRRRQGSSGVQKVANLPIDHITPDKPPFSSVGMDFFGPFL